jgi:CheY-like chemotaxis protein
MMGGTITARSNGLNRGSVFTGRVSLHCVHRAPSAIEAAAVATEEEVLLPLFGMPYRFNPSAQLQPVASTAATAAAGSGSVTPPSTYLSGRTAAASDMKSIRVRTPATSAAASEQMARSRKPRIISADDHEVNRKVVDRFLRDVYDVEPCENGAQVLALVEKQTAAASTSADPPYACILLDVHMPVMDGVEAARALRQKGCAIPLIAVTANSMCSPYLACPSARWPLGSVPTRCDVLLVRVAGLAQEKDQYLSAGMNLVLTKPFTRADLLKALASVTSAVAPPNVRVLPTISVSPQTSGTSSPSLPSDDLHKPPHQSPLAVAVRPLLPSFPSVDNCGLMRGAMSAAQQVM